MIQIRNYQPSDASALWRLFFQTVHSVNSRDYSKAQCDAWAPNAFDAEQWLQKMNAIAPFIAELDGKIVGYADLQDNGFINHFFCHHEHQGKGIGRALMVHLLKMGKQQGIRTFRSEVSISARAFYEKFGFKVLQEQTVAIHDQKLCNFVMQKVSE